MAHYTNIRHPAHSRVPGIAASALIGALLLVIGVLALSGVATDTATPSDEVAPVAEDWHGNVRRSYGLY